MIDTKKFIRIKGANEHNLKNVEVTIPKNKLVVITGVSGSGKSTLAFDILYNEGNRRYIDSLSNYAKQFLGGTKKPDVQSIEGLSPAIAIDQKTTSSNPRSTVGTITEIYDFYRLLFGRIGKSYCPTHGIEITARTITDVTKELLKEFDGQTVKVLAPVITLEKGTHKDLLKKLKEKGFVRVLINGDVHRLDEEIKLDKNKKHSISIVVDRIQVIKEIKSRLFEAIQTASDYANGVIAIHDGKNEKVFSLRLSCPHGDFSIKEIEPRLFSFNSPVGACPVCNGLGVTKSASWEALIEEGETLFTGGIKFFKKVGGVDFIQLEALMRHYKIDPIKNVEDFTKKEIKIMMEGSGDTKIKYITFLKGNPIEIYDTIEGIGKKILRRYLNSPSDSAKKFYSQFLLEQHCKVCDGTRLNPEALSVKINNINIADLTKMSIEEAYNWILSVNLSKQEQEITSLVIDEIISRFDFLLNVGLKYLTLDRVAHTLSGGESQRIRLASQLGSKLSGVLYVLDEPSIGLHQRDNMRLIKSLKAIRDLGNSVIVVEHDEETMFESDHIINIGPLAGDNGGTVDAQGNPSQVAKSNTWTGKFMSGREYIEIPRHRRKHTGNKIIIKGARENNLKNLDVSFPLNQMVMVTGVSGSGKSTLVNEILYKGVHNKLTRRGNFLEVGEHDSIGGVVNLDKVIQIDQSPIGKTPRSNPATYTKAMDDIRDLFAATKGAKIRGYNKGRFSFNVKGGRCEKCEGAGVIKVSMHFLPDVFIQCEECKGKRYNDETLLVKYKDKTIYQVLQMTIDEATKFFENVPLLHNKLGLLQKVGLGYIILGHPSTTLSGGESQRVKLAYHLQKKATGRTLFILDEPTTGLHSYDIKHLLSILNRIVDNGDSMIIIEHNLDVIKQADHIIDLGPEGGNEGGAVVATGTPEQVAGNSKSVTGKCLKKIRKI